MNIKRFLEKCVPLFIICPFIVGAVGYYSAGEKLSDALYASFALYFVNPVSDACNIPVEIARWSAALVTTAAILYAVRRIWTIISQAFRCLGKDSIAVYSDENINIVFDKPKRNVIYSGREFRPLAKSHIIMLDSDAESLKFYETNKSRIKNQKVYIALRELEYGFIREFGDLCFYDIDGAVARTLWKQIALWKNPEQHTQITILGTGHLGQSVLNYGLLLNLYSLNQEITYNFIGTDSSYRVLHGNIQTCNSDRVCYHGTDDEENVGIIRNSDIVIICSEISVAELQTVAAMCKGTLYCYSPSEGRVMDYLDFPALKPFGKNSDIYTDENIRCNRLINDAMRLHYSYLSRFGNGEIFDIHTEWNKLNGFVKWSNISSADFIPILKSLEESGADIEELANLEHIRWCRFHFLNFWQSATPENEKNCTNKNKTHRCLCSFNELSEEDKEKNRAAVREALSD